MRQLCEALSYMHNSHPSIAHRLVWYHNSSLSTKLSRKFLFYNVVNTGSERIWNRLGTWNQQIYFWGVVYIRLFKTISRRAIFKEKFDAHLTFCLVVLLILPVRYPKSLSLGEDHKYMLKSQHSNAQSADQIGSGFTTTRASLNRTTNRPSLFVYT